MDFIIRLPILMDEKRDSYNLIFVIGDRPTKNVYYEPVKVIIDVPSLAEVIITIEMRHYNLLDSIVPN